MHRNRRRACLPVTYMYMYMYVASFRHGDEIGQWAWLETRRFFISAHLP